MNDEKRLVEMTKVFNDILDFTKEALNKQDNLLNKEVNSLQNMVNRYVANGEVVPKTIQNSLNQKKNQIQKIQNSIISVESIIEEIKNEKISANTTSEKIKNIQGQMKNFFGVYKYKDQTLENEVDLQKGESQFERIIKDTDTYAKLSGKIDALNEKASLISLKMAAKGKEMSNSKQVNFDYKVKLLRNKQIRISSAQKIIMLKRQQYINKRNKKISKLEAKKTYFEAKSDVGKTEEYERKINNLRTKKIRGYGAKTILLKQAFIGLFHKKYDKDGNIDYRSWQERRLAALEKKAGKSL